MNKTEQKQISIARQYATIWPIYAARILSVLRRSTRNNVTIATTAAVINEFKLEDYFVPGTNYMLTR